MWRTGVPTSELIFSHNNDIYLKKDVTDLNSELRLTFDGKDNIYNGVPGSNPILFKSSSTRLDKFEASSSTDCPHTSLIYYGSM